MFAGTTGWRDVSIDTQSSLTLTENRLLDSSFELLVNDATASVRDEHSLPAKIRKMSMSGNEHESLDSNFSALLHRVDRNLATPIDMVFHTSGDLGKKSVDIIECKVAPPADISGAKASHYCFLHIF